MLNSRIQHTAFSTRSSRRNSNPVFLTPAICRPAGVDQESHFETFAAGGISFTQPGLIRGLQIREHNSAQSSLMGTIRVINGFREALRCRLFPSQLDRMVRRPRDFEMVSADLGQRIAPGAGPYLARPARRRNRPAPHCMRADITLAIELDQLPHIPSTSQYKSRLVTVL